MTPDRLARMANDVASYFRAYPEETAVAEIRRHLESFWPRRMREDALAALGRPDVPFDPLVVRALESMRVAEAARDTTGRTA